MIETLPEAAAFFCAEASVLIVSWQAITHTLKN
jgi:hypothetical protein